MAVTQVSAGLSVNTVGASGNVGPCGHLGNFFAVVVVLTLVPERLVCVLLADFENVLEICVHQLAISGC